MDVEPARPATPSGTAPAAAERPLRAGQRRLREPWRPATSRAQAPPPSPFAPVRGVTLELFADIARAVASQYEAGISGTELAKSCGVSAADWIHASRTWNNRIADHPEVAERISELYRSRVVDLREPHAS